MCVGVWVYVCSGVRCCIGGEYISPYKILYFKNQIKNQKKIYIYKKEKNMEVQLINITNKPIENIFKSYRICYSKLPYSEVKERTEEDMIKFIKPLMAENHTSPLEHINLTFAID